MQFDDVQLCEEHEKKHKSVDKILKSEYCQLLNSHGGYPDSLYVKMDNGEVIIYRFSREAGYHI